MMCNLCQDVCAQEAAKLIKQNSSLKKAKTLKKLKQLLHLQNKLESSIKQQLLTNYSSVCSLTDEVRLKLEEIINNFK